ncbi:MAG: nucleoside hydrolase, partial [Candidatus Helarchaeota archaeon]|nr:nucleoside hydrolase [Candidatus Helarchaeota archaeon]
AAPISGKLELVAKVHGKDGLGDTQLPLPDSSTIRWENLNYIISTITSNPHEYTLVSVGPLTNLASLLQNGPKAIVDSVKEVIIMGGAVTVPGNVTPYAEFNIFCDPHAAKIVFDSELPITLIGLDVTHKVVMKDAHIKQLEAKNTPLTNFVAKIAHFYKKFHEKVEGCYLHDPLTAAVAIDPTLISTNKFNLDVITNDFPEIGQTIPIDSTRNPNISVALIVNEKKFLDFFLNTLLM